MYVSGKSHLRLFELHGQYGPVVRVAPDELSYIVPEAWEDIMGRYKPGQRNENPKAPWYAGPKDNAIVGAAREDHTRMRRLLSNGFSASAMLEQQTMIQGYIDLLIDRLKERSNDGKALLDIREWFVYCTFDIIGDLSFGEPFGCLRDSIMHPWIALIFANLKLFSIFLVCKRIPLLFMLLPIFISRKLFRQFMEHQKVSKEKIAKRLALKDVRSDFVQNMISGKGDFVSRVILRPAN